MAFEPNTIIEVRVKTRCNSQDLWNVLHYKPSANGTGFLPNDMLDGLLAQITGGGNGTLTGEMKPLLGTNASIKQVVAQVVYPNRMRARFVDVNVAGTAGGACTAQNIQATITKLGPAANKHNTGSMHIGGIAAVDYTAGTFSVDFMTRLESFKTNFLIDVQFDNISPVEYDPAILNRTKVIVTGKEKFLISGATVFDVATTHPEVRTQRTRTVGHGK